MTFNLKACVLTVLFVFVLLFPSTRLAVNTSSPKDLYLNTEKEYHCLLEGLYYEARGESETGIRAVASVLYNRKQAKGYPSTYCSVLHQPFQFSYRNNTKVGKSLKTTVKPSERKAYLKLQSIAFEAATGAFKPILAPNVLFFCTVSVDKPPVWSVATKKAATIGNHIFFKA